MSGKLDELLPTLSPAQRRAVEAQVGEQQGQAKVRAPRGMNRWESDYAMTLGALHRAGHILWWGWEAMAFRLADRTRYTPDFMVMRCDGTLEAIEVKGFARDDAIVKFKVAAQLCPFIHWIMVRKVKGKWEIVREYPATLTPTQEAHNGNVR